MRLTLCLTLALASAFAQAPAQDAFEVASVKPSTPQERFIAIFTYPGGRVAITNYSLHDMLYEAFHLQPFQVTGGPRWIDEDRFSIQAKPPASSPVAKLNPAYPKVPPTDAQRRMLLNLLIERFQLKFHHETREGAIYLLTKTNKELKLVPPKDPDAYPWAGSLAGGGISGDGLKGTNITMPLLAERLSPYLQRPVVDRTGLQGSFDFQIEHQTEQPYVDVLPSIFTCIQGLGLKLEAAKGPVDFIVIDHAEKPNQ
ncbi:MAG TPA: TIGR03435 family protein [Candidatus Sulfopaludibacter sp.]|nr:TIGR03435 family protein [Candidatus Sulfopaludibacter sp.]